MGAKLPLWLYHGATRRVPVLCCQVRLSRPCPGADQTLLAGCDDAVIHEHQDSQPLMCNLLAHQWLQQWHFMHAWAQRGAQDLSSVQPVAPRRHVDLIVAFADVAQAVVTLVLLLYTAAAT